MQYSRILNLREILAKKSHFLFGPRQTGKSTLVENQLQDAYVIDLLDGDEFDKFLKRPRLLGDILEKNPARIVVIDEVQKLPSLLDEVQRLMKKKTWTFLLTGSSARKLKKKGTNLLAGRAWTAHLMPLVYNEIADFDLATYLNRGGLPSIYQSTDPLRELREYCQTYLRQEIQDEALVRNLRPFATFLEVIGKSNGQEIVKQNIAEDCGVSDVTIAHYLEILYDTLIAFPLPAFTLSLKRKPIRRAKNFIFDIGVANSLAEITTIDQSSPLFGQRFEHFIINEIRAYLHYHSRTEPMSFWRSTSDFEVDCIVGQILAIEIKATMAVKDKHLKSLRAFKEEQLCQRYLLVSQDRDERKTKDGIEVWPWQQFLKHLWLGNLL